MNYYEEHPPYIGRAKAFQAGHLPGETGHCLLYGKQTGNVHSLSISTLRKGSEAPLHVHSREDETFFVISGRMDARIGDDHFTLNEGDSVFLPRGLKHRILCLSDEAKILMLIHPPGLEEFFDEINHGASSAQISKPKMKEIAARYGVTILEE